MALLPLLLPLLHWTCRCVALTKWRQLQCSASAFHARHLCSASPMCVSSIRVGSPSLPARPLAASAVFPRCRGQVSKKTLVENLDLLLLSIDEIVDEGLILETDSTVVVSRVCMVGGGADGGKDVPLSEQTFTQALQTARDQLVRSFR